MATLIHLQHKNRGLSFADHFILCHEIGHLDADLMTKSGVICIEKPSFSCSDWLIDSLIDSFIDLLGQLSEVENIIQLRSKIANSISLFWRDLNSMIDMFYFTFEVETFLLGSKIDVLTQFGYAGRGSWLATLKNLPLQNATYGVEVYRKNSKGKGYRKRLFFKPNLTMFFGPPLKVQELSVWDSGKLEQAIVLRWKELSYREDGYARLEGYNITWSETESGMIRSTKMLHSSGEVL